MGRTRARDFDFTIRRRVHIDVDRTVKRRRVDLAPTVRRVIDVEKAFACEDATECVEPTPGEPDAADDAPQLDVDLPELQEPAPVRTSTVMPRAGRVPPLAVRIDARASRTPRPSDGTPIARWVVVASLLIGLVAFLVTLLAATRAL